MNTNIEDAFRDAYTFECFVAEAIIHNLIAGYTIDPEDFVSKGRATPFAGWKVSGENLMTIVGGKIVWQK